jgi:transglutaminase-like putative cysteine protease
MVSVGPGIPRKTSSDRLVAWVGSGSWRRVLRPAEGWSTVLFHAVVVLISAWTLRESDWSPSTITVSGLALGGFLFGLLSAKLALIDLVGHLLAVWFGIALSAWLTLDTAGESDGRFDRGRQLVAQSREWYRHVLEGRRIDDPHFFRLVLGLTVWLIAYTSAWVLYRRQWLAPALVLPGAIAVVNIGYSGDSGSTPLLVFLAASCLLTARYQAYSRDRAWARTRMLRPTTLPWRFVGAGANIAVVVALIAWSLPLSSRATLSDAVWSHAEDPWSAVQQRVNHIIDRFAANRDGSTGSYAAFGESFDLGGPLKLSDQEVALLQPATGGGAIPETYLAAHRYDRYDGHGWKSDVETTFQAVGPSGKRYSPQMTFAAGQGVSLSTLVTLAREEIPGRVTRLRTSDDLMLTTYTHLSTEDRRTSIQVSWQSLDDVAFAVSTVKLVKVPPDLRRLVSLLRSASFSGATGADGQPIASEPSAARAVAAEHDQLAARFLSTGWEVGPDGRASTLRVSGQIPIYDDVEAVFSLDELATGSTYELKGLASFATQDQLAAAPTEYPPFVQGRYLQLPVTVTVETTNLASEVTAGLTNPFDQAIAIQTYLRSAIVYDEDISVPPKDRDVVDYVLFESRRGYCEYYASAMTVMLRSLGVPARIAVGFFSTPWDETREGYLYRERNAHAWVEVFFPTFGWIPFEPTSSQRPLDYGGTPPAPTGAASPIPEPTPVSTAAPEPETATSPTAVPPPLGTTDDEPESHGRSALVARAATFGLVGLAVLSAFVALIWNRRFSGLTPAGALYARALRGGRWFGLRSTPATTPAEYAERLGRAVPTAAEPARTLAGLYETEHYGPPTRAGGGVPAGKVAWRQLRGTLLRSLVRRRGGKRG